MEVTAINHTDDSANTPQPKRHGGGPKTQEGKERSKLNALKHGLNARTPKALEVLALEAGINFREIHGEMEHFYRPEDPVEEQLVKRIARCVFRLYLGEAMEARLIQRGGISSPGASYDRILKYERLVDIHLHRAIQALQSKRKEQRNCNRNNELPPRFR